MFWNFGVSREIRYEVNCRKDNRTAKILTFDPTPLSNRPQTVPIEVIITLFILAKPMTQLQGRQ